MKRLTLLIYFILISAIIDARQVEQYTIFELELKGPSAGNPFTDVQLSAEFRLMNRSLFCEGFYDGNGIYRIRFMPDQTGEWTYSTRSNIPQLDSKNGSITCTNPSADNHGPVKVRNTFDFGYSDGTPFYPVGTTCYAWVHQPEDLVNETLATLTKTAFNKIRMTVMPKNYDVYINNEPPFYPFEGSKETGWDFSRPNPAFFRNFEQKILELQKLGIEADVILFHPYDAGKWNLDKMNSEQAVFYLHYLIARIAAFLHRIITEAPIEGVYPFHNQWNKETYLIKDREWYLFYYGNSQQAMARVMLPKDRKFRLEVIDAWNMTITPVAGEFSGRTEISLPGRPYVAVRAKVINEK